MSDRKDLPRRKFLKQAAGALGAASQLGAWPAALAETASQQPAGAQEAKPEAASGQISYPRVFTGPHLKMISFPLGGVAAGSLGLGGRGQLRDWQIFNRPAVGASPAYAFPSLWVQKGSEKPIAHVLEARILPPYEGPDGLGARNVPGLSRLRTARFTGEYPLAHIDFEDGRLPVSVSLDAFSPFIPHEPDDSGLPVAILRYRVTNPGPETVKAAIALSIDNPMGYAGPDPAHPIQDQRTNEFRATGSLTGLLMTNPGIASDDPMQGSFALAALPSAGAGVSHWRGWPKDRWWNSPMLFWDEFSQHGQLGAEPEPHDTVGALCLRRSLAPGGSASFTFLLAWHYPNRTPEWCGWEAPPGEGKTIIGNYYTTRFADAWAAAVYAAGNLPRLEANTRLFAEALRSSTLPAAVKDAASANLSTLASTTCFRTADGEFHGFEGSGNDSGCCFGNCTHVWNYETATGFLFPSFARSLRKASFGYSMDPEGGMRFRQLLPDGKKRFDLVAADGQMGQVVHAYLDWRLSGDRAWLADLWPRIQKAMAFAWEPDGWDPGRIGVLTGVQHNTYDVEFYGPNPMCSIYYLAALRSSEEMARAMGDSASAAQYRRIFEKGSRWIDANLFTGQFYIQQIRGFRPDQIAPHLRSDMGSSNTEHPEYQVGTGCFIDQLIGQCLADVAGLGPMVSPAHVRESLESIYRYNYKRTLIDHDNVERTYALNDEAAVVICDYANAPRPRIPFPYYAEAWTGLEHATAALMTFSGMPAKAAEYIHNTRARFDGEKRNPWDEAECGHHYARAMSSWSSFVAFSGFSYDAPSEAVAALPPLAQAAFQCFWSTANGWGTFSYKPTTSGGTRFTLQVLHGSLSCRTCALAATGSAAFVRADGRSISHSLQKADGKLTLRLSQTVSIHAGSALTIDIKA